MPAPTAIALQLLEPRFAKAARLLRDAEPDVLAYMAFPADHWPSISSTNAIERLNAEIDRRAKVVGIFPTTPSLLRLATAVVQDQHDEWQDDRQLFTQHSMALLLHPDGPPLLTNPLTEGLVAQLIDVVRAPRNSHHVRGLDPDGPRPSCSLHCPHDRETPREEGGTPASRDGGGNARERPPRHPRPLR